LYGRVGKGQRAGALTVDRHGLVDLTKRVFAHGAIVADRLDVQETSVGLEADLPQGGQIMQPFADVEVAGVVDGGFRAQGTTLLVILPISNGIRLVSTITARRIVFRRY